MDDKDKLHIGGYSEDTFIDKILDAVTRLFDKKAWKPLIKSMLLSGIHSGIDRMINNGNTNPYYQQNSVQGFMNYNQKFLNAAVTTGVNQIFDGYGDNPSNVYIMCNEATAYRFRDTLINCINSNPKHYISVTKANRICDKPDRDWTDRDWGWTDVNAIYMARIEPRGHGEKYALILPPPVSIKHLNANEEE
jgi:hypothetical protein